MGINEIVILLVVIALGVATFALASYAWDERVMIAALARALFQRYFTISIDVGRLADVNTSQVDRDDYDDAISGPSRTHSQSSGKVHSEALEGVPEDDMEWLAEGLDLTKEQWLTFLAKSNMLDSEGLPQPFTKAKLAALVGVRAEDANKVIDVARGVELREKPTGAKPDPRFPELTAHGRGVSAALKGK